MRRIILILTLFISIQSFGQTPTGYQKRIVNERIQGSFMVDSAFNIPRYYDTTAANLHKRSDTCGAMFFAYGKDSIYYRACNPKRWISVGSGSGVGTSIYDESVVKRNDSVFLRGEKNNPPTTNTFYGRNNTNDSGYFSAAIINLTNVENKHFLNHKNGEWLNTKYFQEMKFIVGENIGYPSNGDSTFSDTSFAYRKLNLFRDGMLRYEGDTIDGYEINHTTSKITFHPPLFTSEKIIIQLYDTLQWNSITHEVVEEYVDFTTSGDLTESPTGTWTSAAGTGKGFSTKSLATGDDGYFVITNSSSTHDSNPIGLDDDGSNVEAYTAWECTVYRNSGNYKYHDNNPIATNSGITASDGDWVRFVVIAGVIKAQYSTTSGASWIDIHTFSTPADHILYAKTDIPVGGKAIKEAKIFNFQ